MNKEVALKCLLNIFDNAYEWHVCIPFYGYCFKKFKIKEDVDVSSLSPKDVIRNAEKQKMMAFLDWLEDKGYYSYEFNRFIQEISFFQQYFFYEKNIDLQRELKELKRAVLGPNRQEEIMHIY